MTGRLKDRRAAERFIDAVARHQDWEVNADEGFVADLADGLAVNYNRYGYFLCPCRDGDGERKADADIICPCDYARPDQAEHGHCYCGLFLTREFFRSGVAPRPIAERRT